MAVETIKEKGPKYEILDQIETNFKKSYMSSVIVKSTEDMSSFLKKVAKKNDTNKRSDK